MQINPSGILTAEEISIFEDVLPRIEKTLASELWHMPAKDFGAMDELSRSLAGDKNDSDDSNEEGERLGEIPKLRVEEKEMSSAFLAASITRQRGRFVDETRTIG
jgi:hypothetical protein